MVIYVVRLFNNYIILNRNLYYDIPYIKNVNVGDLIKINYVLLFKSLNNEKVFYNFGTPLAFNKNETMLVIIQHFNSKKLICFRYKRKKNYKKMKVFSKKFSRVFCLS